MTKKIDNLLDELNDTQDSLRQVLEMKHMYEWLMNNMQHMTVNQHDYINDQLEGLASDIWLYKTEIGKLKRSLNQLQGNKKAEFHYGGKKLQKLRVIQWGEKRTIVELTYLDTKEDPTILIMDNDYLMNLDEMGLIE